MILKPIASIEQGKGIRVIEFSHRPIVDSDSYNNVIIDYDKNGNVVSLEILPFMIGKNKKSV